MAMPDSPPTDPNPIIDRVVEGIEMRGVSMPGPDGPVVGYQWRLRLRIFGTYPDPDRTEMSAWVFGSEAAVDQILGAWQQFLTTQGHWAGRPPPMNLG